MLFRIHPRLVILFLIFSLTLSLSPSALCKTYLTEEEALRDIFPSTSRVTVDKFFIDKKIKSDIEKVTQKPVLENVAVFSKIWEDNKLLGYSTILNEKGKHRDITFFVGITPEGRVAGVRVLEYREPRGGEIRRTSFLNQFLNKQSSAPLKISEDIDSITGATISVRSAATAVKRSLLLWDAFYSSPKRNSAGLLMKI